MSARSRPTLSYRSRAVPEGTGPTAPLPPWLASRGPGAHWLFVSPHLDDAVLSCGALMDRLAIEGPTTVATVFSSAGPLPWSIPAYRALARYGRDPFALFEARRQEDLTVLGDIPVNVAPSRLPDGLFRTRGGTDGATATMVGRLRSRAPCYPTFRWDLARGHVARPDRGLVDQVTVSLTELAQQLGPDSTVVFAPLAIGRHVDHIITRDATARLTFPVVYYSDFPYSESALPDRAFVQRLNLVPYLWQAGREANADRVRGYRSQLDVSFPDGKIPTRPEVYWQPVVAKGPVSREHSSDGGNEPVSRA